MIYIIHMYHTIYEYGRYVDTFFTQSIHIVVLPKKNNHRTVKLNFYLLVQCLIRSLWNEYMPATHCCIQE